MFPTGTAPPATTTTSFGFGFFGLLLVGYGIGFRLHWIESRKRTLRRLGLYKVSFCRISQVVYYFSGGTASGLRFRGVV